MYKNTDLEEFTDRGILYNENNAKNCQIYCDNRKIVVK